MNVGRPAIAALALFTTIGLSGCAVKSHSDGSTAASTTTPSTAPTNTTGTTPTGTVPGSTTTPTGASNATGTTPAGGSTGTTGTGTGTSATGTGTTGTGTGTGTGTADPTAELVATGTKLANTPVKVKISLGNGLTLQGSLDAASQRAALTQVGPNGTIRVRQLGTDIYVKVSGALASALGGSAANWLHVNTAQVAAESLLNLNNLGPQSTATLLATSTSVRQTSSHTFKGTLDLTKSPNSAALLNALGGKANAVPFTATTDSQGRLTQLALTYFGSKVTLDYSGFGTPVSVQAPSASTVIELPAQFSKFLGV